MGGKRRTMDDREQSNSIKTRIKCGVVILCSVVIFLFVYNNFSQYDTTIVKINDIVANGYTQNITATVMNGDRVGKTVRLKNHCGDSLVYDNKYHKGNFLFINEKTNGSGWTITGMKRDYFMVLALLVLFDLLLLIGGKQGFYTIVGLFVNVLIYMFALYEYTQGRNIIFMSIIAAVVSACVILVLINGINRISAASIFATVVTVAAVALIAAGAMKFSARIQYEFMDFLPEPYTMHDADLALIAEVMVGCLGAVVDIAVIMTSSAAELKRRKPEITSREIFKSCRVVADDVMGTMINIVLLTNIAAFIPVFVLSLQNGFGIETIIRNNLYFEILRFLTSSIGIVIAIPISIYVASRVTVPKRGSAVEGSDSNDN